MRTFLLATLTITTLSLTGAAAQAAPWCAHYATRRNQLRFLLVRAMPRRHFGARRILRAQPARGPLALPRLTSAAAWPYQGTPSHAREVVERDQPIFVNEKA